MDKQIDIKALRTSLDLSQEGLAALLGVDQSTVSNWERDNTTPRGPALKLLTRLSEEASGEAA